MREKKGYWIIFLFPIFYMIFFLFIFLHEVGHFIMIILTNTKFYRFGTNDLGFAVFHESVDGIKGAIISLGGILMSSIVLFPLLCITIKKKSLVFSIPITLYLFLEYFYFGLSPIIKFGDSYNYCNSLNISYLYIIVFGFFVCFLLFILILFLIKKYLRLYLPNYKDIDY